MQGLNTNDIALAKKLAYNSRYIDDIACPHIGNFIDIAKHIYPKDIPLESNNSNDKQDVFLDLDIHTADNGFTIKIYYKR